MAAITILTYAAQADTGAGSAVDVSAYSTLRLDLALAHANTSSVEPEVDITIEDAPTSTGPWRKVEKRKYVSGSSSEVTGWTSRRRFVLGNFDKFVRVSWDASVRISNRATLNLSVGLAGEAI